MEDDEPISRKRKMDNRSNHDFLSDLPLNIIHCILALVPIRDAVRTCILSTQWRYKWASLPQLVFDDECVDRSKSVECLKNIVTNALLLHEGPIQKFRLHTSLLNSCPATDRWLLCLSRKEIRELCLDISYPLLDSWFRVHNSLYSCRKLTHLELSDCELRPPPLTFNGFSCLRSLVLCCVKVSSDVVESLVANSPLLENFTSLYSADGELRISDPNLKCFHIWGDFKEINLYAPVVAKVSVDFSEVDFTAEQQQSTVCNYTKFLGGFTNLESLAVFSYFTKYLNIGIESYDRSLVFHRLKYIELSRVSFHDTKQMSVLLYLLLGAPNLQKFRIWMFRTKKDASEAPPISFKDFGCTDSFRFEKLKDVRMVGVCGSPYEMEFIKFLLKSSPVLGKMTLQSSFQPCHKGLLSMTAELPRYGRASPNAKIYWSWDDKSLAPINKTSTLT